MKTVVTIEARMRSSRLPGKVLKPILGRPMLALMIERLQRARLVDEIVVATTDTLADNSIVDLACQLDVSWFRGSEEDVLERVLKAAESVNGDVIVETTGDCPLIDPNVIDHLITTFKNTSVDYCSNVLKRTYPRGVDVQVFPVAVLAQVAELTQDPADREHVSLYIYEHPERFSLHNVESGLPEKYWDLRLTVDTPEDFALITAIYEELYPKDPAFTLWDVLDLVDRKPELVEINRQVQQRQSR